MFEVNVKVMEYTPTRLSGAWMTRLKIWRAAWPRKIFWSWMLCLLLPCQPLSQNWFPSNRKALLFGQLSWNRSMEVLWIQYNWKINDIYTKTAHCTAIIIWFCVTLQRIFACLLGMKGSQKTHGVVWNWKAVLDEWCGKRKIDLL